MKRSFLTALTLTLSATTANAASIWLVDIDGRKDTDPASNPGGAWNVWRTNDLNPTRGDNTRAGIVDQDGLNPLTAVVTARTGAHGRNGSGATGTTLTLAGAPVGNAVVGDGLGGPAATWNGDSTSNNNDDITAGGNVVDFTISGLDNAKQYSMSFLMAVGGDGFSSPSYENPFWIIAGDSTVNGEQTVFDAVNNVSTGTSALFMAQTDGTIDITVDLSRRTRPGRHTLEAFAIVEAPPVAGGPTPGTPIPEPTSLLVGSLGLCGILIRRRRGRA